jgi:alcohol dehydrogenase class IV
MSFEFAIPNKVFMGEGALTAASGAIKQAGTHALIVTGKVVTKSGLVDKLTAMLDEIGIKWTVFNDITGEPNDKMIDAGVAVYKANGCDFGIGIGGGSPLDSVKAILVMATEGGKIADLNGKFLDGKYPPIVAIPTTAGTGSEATKFTVITDTATDVKMLLKGNIVPDIAIVDPSFTLSAPSGITAATGMDAFTHAVEAYTSKAASSLTDVFALSAVKRIFKYLPIAYKDGNNTEAREQLATAAFEAGVCINNSSVTLVHGMSRPIGALFHVPHGISNAMLIKECLSYVIDGTPERFADLAVAMGVAKPEDDILVSAQAFICGVERLCEACEIPTLEGYGIDREEFFSQIDKMSSDAMASGSPSNTRKAVTKDDLSLIYKKLWA